MIKKAYFVVLALSLSLINFSYATSNSVYVDSVELNTKNAINNNTYNDGWTWVLNITVPTDENKINLKISDINSASSSILSSSNVKYWSPQSTNANSLSNAKTVTAANSYGEFLNVDQSADIDNGLDGRQIAIYVQAKVPTTNKEGLFSAGFDLQGSGDAWSTVLNSLTVNKEIIEGNFIKSPTSTVYGNIVANPTADKKSGSYLDSIRVSLKAIGADYIIYTTNGNEPTCLSGNMYGNAMTIESTTTLKAISCYGDKSSPMSSWTYNFVRADSSTQKIADSNGNMELLGTQNQALITNDLNTYNINILAGVASSSADLSGLISAGVLIVPELNINSGNASDTKVYIQGNTTINLSTTTWDGKFSFPTLSTSTYNSDDNYERKTDMAVMLGVPNIKLTLDKAARILLSGQAGKKIAWTSDDASYQEVTNVCTSDRASYANTLASGSDCKIDIGNDMVVWTKHFTTFASYSETAKPKAVSSSGSSGGGGGGGGSIIVTTNTASASNSNSVTVVPVTPIIVAGFTEMLASTTAKMRFGNYSSNTSSTTSKDNLRFDRNFKKGDKHADVVRLQKLLKGLGYFEGDTDVNYGPRTRKAVIKFQKDNKLPQTGYFGPMTREALLSSYTQ